MRLLLLLLLITICVPLKAQWSRSDQTVRLTHGDDKIYISSVAPIDGGIRRLYLTGDASDYGNLLVHFDAKSMASNHSLLRLGATSNSHDNSKLLYGTKGATTVFEFLTSGKLNLLASDASASRALDIRGDEAIWYDGEQYSWGFGGTWNRFAQPVAIGSGVEPPTGTGLYLTGSRDIRFDGVSGRYLDFFNGETFQGRIGHNGFNMIIDNNTTGSITLQTNGATRLRVNSDGQDTQIFGNLNISGGINGISDERTKKNIQPIESALDIIVALQGKTFEFNQELYPALNLPAVKQFGLIAQEVEKIAPDLVSQHTSIIQDDKVVELKGVQYQSIIPLLIEAIKEQNKTIEDLSRKVLVMEERLSVSDCCAE